MKIIQPECSLLTYTRVAPVWYGLDEPHLLVFRL